MHQSMVEVENLGCYINFIATISSKQDTIMGQITKIDKSPRTHINHASADLRTPTLSFHQPINWFSKDSPCPKENRIV